MVYNNLATIFSKIGVTAEQVGEALGFRNGVLSRKLSGTGSFTLGEMLRIQEYVKQKISNFYSLDYLFVTE